VLQLALSRELPKFLRLESISTVGRRGCMASDSKVRRLDTLEEMVHDGVGGRNPQSLVASK
jgi:hypothetical protein